MTLATSTKNDTQWQVLELTVKNNKAILWTRTANSHLNSKEVGCFAKLEKTACQEKESDEVEKQTKFFCPPELEKRDVFAKREFEKLNLIYHV